MRRLLPLALLLLTPSLASAQWTFSKVFPDSSRTKALDNVHGLAVDGEGKIWIQPYYARSGDSVFVAALNAKRISSQVYVFNPDGTPASFSPITFLDFPNGTRDTLGGSLIRNASGVQVWDGKTGRGLRTDKNGDILISQFNDLYRVNHKTGAGMNKLRMTTLGLDNRGLTAAAVDNANRIYITGVFGGDPVAVLNPDFSFRENVVGADPGFSRAFDVSMTGDTVFYAGYDKDAIYRYIRPDEFSAYGATPDTVLRGISAESFTWHPTTGHLWLSSGSPNDPPAAPYVRNTWYAFDPQDLSPANPRPMKRDSITWEDASGRPRGIAFSKDGKTAYVALFSMVAPNTLSVRRYVNTTTGVDQKGWVDASTLLGAPYPNPTNGRIGFRYTMPAAGAASLRVFDLLGRELATVADGVLPGGERTATFDGAHLPAGTYLVRFEVGGHTMTRTFSVVR